MALPILIGNAVFLRYLCRCNGKVRRCHIAPSLHACFTYSLPEDMAESVQIGCRVVVPFGRKKYYTAIVQNIHYSAPAGYEVKEVSALLDAHPILLPEQFRFWDWLADYYLCTRGDVYKAALPSGLKLESETIVEYNPDFESDVQLPEKEQKILDLLAAEPEQCITKLEKGERHQEYPVRN